MNGIYFPGIGISFPNVSSGITIFGFEIKFYAIVITLGFVFATLISQREARLSGQDPEDYLDFVLAMVIPVIIGARLYYIIFNHESFFGGGKTAWQTFVGLINLRNGGLAVYGGLIAGTITAIIFGKKKKITMPLMWDTVSMGVLFGQMLGRWGNFFNREAFGEYTDNLFAMQLPVSAVRASEVTETMRANQVIADGITYIQVHPTFLYESLWNAGVLLIVFFTRKRTKFKGELFTRYIGLYALGRLWIEGLRTDQLLIPGTHFAVSQGLSGVLAVVCLILTLVLRTRAKTKAENA